MAVPWINMDRHGSVSDLKRRSVIVVQAGTAISRRVRSEPNAYNLITLDVNRISVSVRVWRGKNFEATVPTVYRLDGEEWRLQKSRTPGSSVHPI
jgi:hypothetical protein